MFKLVDALVERKLVIQRLSTLSDSDRVIVMRAMQILSPSFARGKTDDSQNKFFLGCSSTVAHRSQMKNE